MKPITPKNSEENEVLVTVHVGKSQKCTNLDAIGQDRKTEHQNPRADLESHGIFVDLEQGKLVVTHEGELPPDLADRVREAKPELLKALACRHCGSTDIGHGVRWRWCLACDTRLGVSRHAELPDLVCDDDGCPTNERW